MAKDRLKALSLPVAMRRLKEVLQAREPGTPPGYLFVVGAGIAAPRSLLAAFYLNPAGLRAFDRAAGVGEPSDRAGRRPGLTRAWHDGVLPFRDLMSSAIEIPHSLCGGRCHVSCVCL